MFNFKNKSAVAILLALIFLLQPMAVGADLPEQASGQAVISLGKAKDVTGKLVEGYAIIHYAKSNKAKGGGKPGSDPTASCYEFLASGAKWKTTEQYVVASGIDEIITAKSLDSWDSQVSFEIFGSQDASSTVDGADTIAPDGKNEIMWGDVSYSGAIAVANVWGVFSGRPAWREIVEYDVVFDNTDYVWGDADADPDVMDFENIAVHELGHAAGMADLYDTPCFQQTMYGYAEYGETQKRTLEAGDIAGIKKLYK